MTETEAGQYRRRLEQLEAELRRQRRVEESLRQSEERVRLLIEHGRDIVYRYRTQPRGFEYISPAVTEVTGYAPGDFYADPELVLHIVHADDRPLLQEYVAAGDFARPLALRCLRRDGQVAWIEHRGLPARDERGQVTAIDGIARDVSAYRHLLDGLDQRAVSIEERERLVSAFRAIGSAALESLELDRVLDTLAEQVVRAGIFRSLMVALVDHDRRAVRVVRNFLSFDGSYQDGIGDVRPGAPIVSSPTVTRRLGGRLVFSDERIIGTTYDLDDRNITPTVARTGQLTVIDGGDDRFDERFERDNDPRLRAATVSYFIPIQRDGRTLAVIATGSRRDEKPEVLRRIHTMAPLLDQAAIALDHALVYGRIRDHARDLNSLNSRLRDEVSRRLRAEDALREFSSRTVNLAEEERRRVARELHDGVNQLLCAVGFGLEAAARDGGGSQPGLERTRELLDRTIHEVRRISQDLRPDVLDDLGLNAAVRSLCEEFGQRTGIPAVHDLQELPPGVPAELAITVYRLLQEALYRLERQHAAGTVAVRLRSGQGHLSLEVTDDGRQGPAEDADESRSLRGMRERAGLFGGQLCLDGAGGGGSCLTVRFPLKSSAP